MPAAAKHGQICLAIPRRIAKRSRSDFAECGQRSSRLGRAEDGMRKPLPDSDAHTWREPVPSVLCAADRSRAHDGSAASRSAINIHASAASPRCAGLGCGAARRAVGPLRDVSCRLADGLHPSGDTVRPAAPTVTRRRLFGGGRCANAAVAPPQRLADVVRRTEARSCRRGGALGRRRS